MSFLNELKNRRERLKPTETIVTYADGRQMIEKGRDEAVVLLGEGKSYGFIVDTKPDLIPAEIIEGRLFLGSQDSVDSTILSQFGITHILSVGIETPPFLNPSPAIILKHIPCLDLPETGITTILNESFEFIESSQNGRFLVHCNAGVSRSSSVVIGYLIKKFSYTFNEAFELVKKKRECIQPNQGFFKQLKKVD